MVETRSYKIGNKIFRLPDVKSIADVLENEFKSAARRKHDSSLNFEVTCFDNSKYETEDTTLFETKSIINSKRVKKLDFTFTDYKDDKRITLTLEHSDYDFQNQLEISGSDSDWVNGRLTILKDLIEGVKPQFTVFKKFSTLFTIISSVSIGTIFLSILMLVVRGIASKSYISPFKLITEEPQALLFLLTIGFFPATFLTDWLKKLWPNVEIQIGPSHTFIEANRRVLLFGIITLIVLPILINIFIK